MWIIIHIRQNKLTMFTVIHHTEYKNSSGSSRQSSGATITVVVVVDRVVGQQ